MPPDGRSNMPTQRPRREPAAAGTGETLGAYRAVTQAQARERWMTGVPEGKRAGLIPPGWFEHWAGVTWATDPEGMRRNPSVLRAPNGALADSRQREPERARQRLAALRGWPDPDPPPYPEGEGFPKPVPRGVPGRQP